MNDSTKTKKIKRNVIKNDLWKKFDEEIKNIDDNPIERELVSSQLPDVTVPNVGDIENFINFKCVCIY